MRPPANPPTPCEALRHLHLRRKENLRARTDGNVLPVGRGELGGRMHHPKPAGSPHSTGPAEGTRGPHTQRL